MKRVLPLAGWIAVFRRDWWRPDIIGGLTAAAVVIPKAMATAVIAGLPVEAGLYTALAAMLVYPLLGTSRPLSVTTTSALAMLTAAQIGALSDGGADPRAVAATLALLVGGILVIARVLRLGFVANFISLPVLVGFEAGVGVVIIVGQLKSVLGVHVTSATTLGTLAELPGLLPHVHGPTMVVAALGLMVLLGLPRLAPRVSASLVWVALSICASAWLALSAIGVKTVGAVPSGLPPLAWPDVSLAAALWPGALGIALMSFTESVAAARAFRKREDAPVVANSELLAIGCANVAVSFVGGMPAGGGTSQTAVADKAGVRSQMAQWIGAAAVVVTLLLLSSLIALLPQAALGALILVSASGMIKAKDFRAIGQIRHTELAWAIATFAGVICIGTLAGILIAVAISLLTLMHQANHPPVYAVAHDPARGIFLRAGADGGVTYPGLLMLRTEGRLTFANAANAAEKMQVLISQAAPRVLVLECGAIPDIEYTALVMMTDAEQAMRARGVTLWLAAVNPDLRKVLDRTPLGATLGAQRFFTNLSKAVEAWQRDSLAASGGKPAPATRPSVENAA